jgi:hypothetical protein
VEPQEGPTDREHTPDRAPAHRRTTMRVIRQTGQPMVLIYESEPSAATPGARALVFESGQWSTKIDQYPPDWRYLADDELLRLQPRHEPRHE